MVLGEKLWEGKGKSGASFIKSVGIEGIVTEYSWMAQLKGSGCAEGVDCNISVTAKGITPPKGVGAAKDQGILTTTTGEIAILKGFDLAKMVEGKGVSVGLLSFMTLAEKLDWINDVIAVVTFEALDAMWQDFNVVIYEWNI
ncbi:MAG: hypothetical protein NWF00_01285 [Candidatus Bathyarchaeota archaeon]|nr:hypothetical protein [Candidatus Bathyarchaeota archaeon]